MTRIYEELRNRNIALYKKAFPDSLACKIIVCGFENYSPFLEVLTFQLDNTPYNPVFVHPYLTENVVLTTAKAFDYQIIGAADCLNEIGQDSAKKVLGRKDKYTTIRHFIKRQSEITPEHVSEPINILKIKSNNTVNWMCQSQQCKLIY